MKTKTLFAHSVVFVIYLVVVLMLQSMGAQGQPTGVPPSQTVVPNFDALKIGDVSGCADDDVCVSGGVNSEDGFFTQGDYMSGGSVQVTGPINNNSTLFVAGESTLVGRADFANGIGNFYIKRGSSSDSSIAGGNFSKTVSCNSGDYQLGCYGVAKTSGGNYAAIYGIIPQETGSGWADTNDGLGTYDSTTQYVDACTVVANKEIGGSNGTQIQAWVSCFDSDR